MSFWDNLVSECQNGPLFDQVLFDKCIDYVIALSWWVLVSHVSMSHGSQNIHLL